MQPDIEWFQEVDSTSDHVRRMVEQRKLFPPATIAALKQTAGRGRGDNRWWSPEGCLMFTSLLDSRLYAREVACLPQAALVIGVALADVLSQYIDAQRVHLKWPNDVYVGDCKIAGVLVEGIQAPLEQLPAIRLESMSESTGFWWMVGVGLNLAINWDGAPPDVRRRATCLATESGISFTPHDFLPKILDSFVVHLNRWRTAPNVVFAEFRERCWLNGKLIEVQQGNVRLRGLCRSIDDSGRLLLASETGARSISSGSITVVE
jgi:BirA family transcriptional regulator, biotin operon repressor / biotin---[acetyl-CoA-carboxylase] ligase